MAKPIILLFTFLLLACNEKEQAKPTELPNNSFTDSRDGKTYKTFKIGERVWMAENLNYNAEGSVCYDNEPANCEQYGRLYNWNTAMKACPKGWHLPSDKEWQILVELVGGKKVAGNMLKATSGWNDDGNGVDSVGFSALPGGYKYEDFDTVGYYGGWWSSSMYDSIYAYHWCIEYNSENVCHYYNYYESILRSVRCVQDKPTDNDLDSLLKSWNDKDITYESFIGYLYRYSKQYFFSKNEGFKSISPADVDADYCLDLRDDYPNAIFVKKYRDLEPILLNIPEKPYFECEDIDTNTSIRFYPFNDSYNVGESFIGAIGCPPSIKKLKISPKVQIDFPISGNVVLSEYRKKKELLHFKNKAIDASIYKRFWCWPGHDLDTSFFIHPRVRIVGECEWIWNIGATDKDSVIADMSSSKTLVIRGKGKMMDFDKPNSKPWEKICDDIDKVVIENGVTSISDNAFKGCLLGSVIIPSSVTSIGKNAFGYAWLIATITSDSITTITMPNIGYGFSEDIFSDFKNVRTITVLAPHPPLLEESHSVDKDICTLYVPKGSIDAYREADGWKEFKNIKAIE